MTGDMAGGGTGGGTYRGDVREGQFVAAVRADCVVDPAESDGAINLPQLIYQQAGSGRLLKQVGQLVQQQQLPVHLANTHTQTHTHTHTHTAVRRSHAHTHARLLPMGVQQLCVVLISVRVFMWIMLI